MKRAQDLLEGLVRQVRPPRGCAIALTERKPKNDSDPNWLAGAGIMPEDATNRYSQAVFELGKLHPRIEWAGVTEFDGEYRRIARWHSEVEQPTSR
ncbi:hypothetical protein [Bradyrhizobium iriomotense]|uniref:hypothetical protein n=1 Tax=Bradyrhizobium iriomotense TaxID=441950 RepID=UPI001B8A1EF4|nr:hypothetical protein [Bradyrhizobium iriomotense]MBR1132915.1 hypothetical protein [Bradyrhizobium iriomotense]